MFSFPLPIILPLPRARFFSSFLSISHSLLFSSLPLSQIKSPQCLLLFPLVPLPSTKSFATSTTTFWSVISPLSFPFFFSSHAHCFSSITLIFFQSRFSFHLLFFRSRFPNVLPSSETVRTHNSPSLLRFVPMRAFSFLCTF